MSSPALSLDQYQLRLPVFEGPLDVLLRLIERDQLAITDLSLVAVTDSFLAYLAVLDDAPAIMVAEFASVAGRLLVLKSRSLLPQPAAAEEEPIIGDLARQLAEHRAFRDAAAMLGQLDRLALAAFPGGESIVRPKAAPTRLALHAPALLRRALLRRLASAVPPASIPTPRQNVSIGEMMQRLLGRLAPSRPLRFGGFVQRADDRLDALVAFLALLVLIRMRAVEALQDDLFGEIEVLLSESADPDAVRAVIVANEGGLG